MKTVRFCCIWIIGFLLVVSCTGKPAQKEMKVSEPPSQEQIPDQSEGWKIIEALSKAYGDNPNIIGDFIGSSRCPDFLEGRYFDGNILVFQVRGDTTSARQTLEKDSGSKAFRIEMMTDSTFSEKRLQGLRNESNRRHSEKQYQK